MLCSVVSSHRSALCCSGFGRVLGVGGRGEAAEDATAFFRSASPTLILLRFGVIVPLAVVVVLEIGTGSCVNGDASTRTMEVSVSALPRRGLDKMGGRGFVMSGRGGVRESDGC